MTKCTTPWHANQVSAAIGNTTSWCSSPNAMVMTRKEVRRSARSAPCLAARCQSLPPAHRHVVQRKGERAKSSVKDPEQGRPPRRLIVFLVCLQCLRHTVMPIFDG